MVGTREAYGELAFFIGIRPPIFFLKCRNQIRRQVKVGIARDVFLQNAFRRCKRQVGHAIVRR